MELKILDGIQSIRTPLGDVVMPLISSFGNGGMIWILLAVILLILPKTRKSGAVLTVALCLDFLLCNLLLKNICGRIRPCDVNTAVQLLIARPRDYSFPSGHTAAAFTSVAALYFAGEKRLWKITLIAAVFIAFSRMYLYVHYPTDILGGVIIGIAAGYLGYRVTGGLEKRRKNRKQDAA